MFFKPLIKKLTGNLNAEWVFSDLQRDDGHEPGFESLLLDIVFDKIKQLFQFSQQMPPFKFLKYIFLIELNWERDQITTIQILK